MILVINAGSTSVKVALFAAPGEDEAVWHTTLDAAALEDDRVGRIVDCLRSSPVSLGDVGAVGHRIVHGADRFDRPVIVDAAAEDAIAAIAELAPLHNQAGLDGIAAARAVLSSSVTHVAVFDTAFHR